MLARKKNYKSIPAPQQQHGRAGEGSSSVAAFVFVEQFSTDHQMTTNPLRGDLVRTQTSCLTPQKAALCCVRTSLKTTQKQPIFLNTYPCECVRPTFFCFPGESKQGKATIHAVNPSRCKRGGRRSRQASSLRSAPSRTGGISWKGKNRCGRARLNRLFSAAKLRGIIPKKREWRENRLRFKKNSVSRLEEAEDSLKA